MGTTTAGFTRQAAYRPALKPVLYLLPVLFGLVAIKAALVAATSPMLGLAMLALVMGSYVGASALAVRLLDRPQYRCSAPASRRFS